MPACPKIEVSLSDSAFVASQCCVLQQFALQGTVQFFLLRCAVLAPSLRDYSSKPRWRVFSSERLVFCILFDFLCAVQSRYLNFSFWIRLGFSVLDVLQSADFIDWKHSQVPVVTALSSAVVRQCLTGYSVSCRRCILPVAVFLFDVVFYPIRIKIING